MHVGDGQGEGEGFPQGAEDVEERDRVGATRDGHQDDFAATEHPVTANGVLDASDQASLPDCGPTQTSPSSKCSFFQIGTVSFSVSMAKRHASKAWARWGEDTAIITLDSPISRRPMRCTRAIRVMAGQRLRMAAADLPHLGQRHRPVRLVLEELHPAPAGLVPHHAREQGQRPGPRMLHRLRHRALRQRLGGDLDPVRPGLGRAAAHRRKQAELVAVPERMIGADVVVAQGEEGVRAVRNEDGILAGDRFPGALDGAPVGELQVQLIAARLLAVAGEQPDLDLHRAGLGSGRSTRTGATSRSRRTTSRSGS